MPAGRLTGRLRDPVVVLLADLSRFASPGKENKTPESLTFFLLSSIQARFDSHVSPLFVHFLVGTSPQRIGASTGVQSPYLCRSFVYDPSIIYDAAKYANFLPMSQHVCWHVFLSIQSSLLLQTSFLFFLIHLTLSAQLSPFFVHFLVAASSHSGSMVGVDVGAAVGVAVGAGVGFGAASA